MIRVGICAPSRADFEYQLGVAIAAGIVPVEAIRTEDVPEGESQMVEIHWGRIPGVPSWCAIGQGATYFPFWQTKAVYDENNVLIAPEVTMSGYCLIIEAEPAMLGYTNTGTTNSGSVVPFAWEKPELLTQLGKSG